MSFLPRCYSEHEFNPHPRHPQAGCTAAAAGGGPRTGTAAVTANPLAHVGRGAVRTIFADPERQPAPGI